MALITALAEQCVLAFAWGDLAHAGDLLGRLCPGGGVFSIIAGFRTREGAKPVWPLLLIGLAGIVGSIATFVWLPSRC